ncbi:anti-sigma factor [Oceanimonas doudoroffii]|uniref:Regulator of SigK n=1 Tax=Oceanimonas doudoroffii TaxID=84158 RepID=A0A233RHI3_9GAMM|nr:anti-sigma factor [Oceanimonas doudoroffii]OXY82863.1 RNA polymerase subunit sigma-70 [Oceanimonas doudoroffii]
MKDGHQPDPALYTLAGEYVLGTLSAEERRRVEQRLQADAALRDAVAQWEERLHPLTALAEPRAPSSRLWPRVERTLDALAPVRPDHRRPPWWRRLLPWQGLSMASLAACVVLAALLWLRPSPAPRYVVVLVAPEQQTPGWLVQASDSREVQLTPLAAVSVPADRVLQFWTKGEDWPRPVSLGLVEPGQPLRVPLAELPPLAPNQLFELTLEQAGGSPTGLPTGPIQFIGRAVAL